MEFFLNYKYFVNINPDKYITTVSIPQLYINLNVFKLIYFMFFNQNRTWKIHFFMIYGFIKIYKFIILNSACFLIEFLSFLKLKKCVPIFLLRTIVFSIQ